MVVTSGDGKMVGIGIMVGDRDVGRDQVIMVGAGIMAITRDKVRGNDNGTDQG